MDADGSEAGAESEGSQQDGGSGGECWNLDVGDTRILGARTEKEREGLGL